MTGDPRFHDLLRQIGELHDKKQKDYGSDTDPFANVRASERWGIPAWVGAGVRLNDKVHRLQQFAIRGELANESAEDSMLDIAVYSIMMLILYRERQDDINDFKMLRGKYSPEARGSQVGCSNADFKHDPACERCHPKP